MVAMLRPISRHSHIDNMNYISSNFEALTDSINVVVKPRGHFTTSTRATQLAFYLLNKVLCLTARGLSLPLPEKMSILSAVFLRPNSAFLKTSSRVSRIARLRRIGPENFAKMC